MRVLELEADVKTWRFYAEQAFGFGNHITHARLYAIYRLIKWRTEYYKHDYWIGNPELAFLEPVHALARLLEFATSGELTAAEMQIYIHLFIDGCNSLLEWVVKKPEEVSTLFDKVPGWYLPLTYKKSLANPDMAYGQSVASSPPLELDDGAADRDALEQIGKALLPFALAAREIPGSMQSRLYIAREGAEDPTDSYIPLPIETGHLIKAERLFQALDLSDVGVVLTPEVQDAPAPPIDIPFGGFGGFSPPIPDVPHRHDWD